MIYLLDVVLPTVVIPITAFVGIATAILLWIRMHPKDKADVTRTDAETAKLLAEAEKTKVDAEVSLTDSAMRIVERLSAENTDCRRDVEKLQADLNKTKDDLEAMRQLFRKSEATVNELQASLDKEKEKNRDNEIEIEQLLAKIEILNRNSGRPL